MSRRRRKRRPRRERSRQQDASLSSGYEVPGRRARQRRLSRHVRRPCERSSLAGNATPAGTSTSHRRRAKADGIEPCSRWLPPWTSPGPRGGQSEDAMRATKMPFARRRLFRSPGVPRRTSPRPTGGGCSAAPGRWPSISGRTGFYGQVLGPGTYFTGTYDELHKVECSTMTVREPLWALTKDGVQFGLNVYVRFSPDCSDTGVTDAARRAAGRRGERGDGRGASTGRTCSRPSARPRARSSRR